MAKDQTSLENFLKKLDQERSLRQDPLYREAINGIINMQSRAVEQMSKANHLFKEANQAIEKLCAVIVANDRDKKNGKAQIQK